MSMCTILLPLCPPFYAILELQARLTPFWKARRLTDEIIERDRKLVREMKRCSRGASGSPEEDRPVSFGVTLNGGFYYVWFRRYSAVVPDIILSCSPLMIAGPDFVVQKSKLRRDQIEYLERGRLRDNSTRIII